MRRYEPHIFCMKRKNASARPMAHVHVDAKNRALEKKLAAGEFQLLYARFGTSGIRMMPLARKWRVPLVTSFHGCDAPGSKRMRKRRKELRRLFRVGALFTVPCEAMRNELLRHGCPDEKVVVHHSGIDLHRFAFRERRPPQPEEGPLRILFVGRLVEKKGADILLRAFKIVRRAFPHTRLVIAGDGKLKPKLVRLARRLGVASGVEFTGAQSVDDIRLRHSEAHIFCLPSKKDRTGNIEGIPNALKEAMASGLPVVSTFHSGIPELIEDGVSGVLVPENRVQPLADALIRLIERPEMWGELARNARRRIEADFDVEKQTARLEELFDRLIEAHRRREERRTVSPLFSVVIPTYNRAKFIGRAIRSVLDQTCDDYEIIVVDDGSTDATPRIVRSFGPQVRYIRQRNRGPSEARNAGIRAARGQYIAFLDSDDRFLPNKLAENKAYFETHPECKFLYSWYYDVRKGRRFLQKVKQYADLDQFRYKLYRRAFTIRTSTVVVHRSCFDHVGLFHPAYRYSQDWDMWLRLAAYYRGHCIRKPLALYRRHLRKPIPARERHRRIRREARIAFRWDDRKLAAVKAKFGGGKPAKSAGLFRRR